jgi:glycosyltransferase involved in cell wall biosynthesis
MGRLIREFRPDVISIWNLGNVSPAVLDAALASGLPLVYSIFDYWLMGYGDNHPWTKLWRYRPGSAWKRGTKRCLEYAVRSLVAETRSPSPRSHSAIYFSEFLKSAHREKGIIFAKSTVIYHGVDLSALHYTPAVRSRGTRLLYAGRLDPDKGVHVAIEALVILTQEFGRNDLTLDIVGESRSPEYADRLRRLADLPELTGRIRFLGWRSRSEVLALLTDYDVMLFPSIWPEPFGIVLIEAMAVGLPVVGTDRGGSVELLRDGKNGLVAAAANPSSMATQINRLMNDPSLRDLLRNEARRDVEIQCDLNVTVDKIEQYLAHTVCRVIPPTCETQLTTV